MEKFVFLRQLKVIASGRSLINSRVEKFVFLRQLKDRRRVLINIVIVTFLFPPSADQFTIHMLSFAGKRLKTRGHSSVLCQQFGFDGFLN